MPAYDASTPLGGVKILDVSKESDFCINYICVVTTKPVANSDFNQVILPFYDKEKIYKINTINNSINHSLKIAIFNQDKTNKFKDCFTMIIVYYVKLKNL